MFFRGSRISHGFAIEDENRKETQKAINLSVEQKQQKGIRKEIWRPNAEATKRPQGKGNRDGKRQEENKQKHKIWHQRRGAPVLKLQDAVFRSALRWGEERNSP